MMEQPISGGHKDWKKNLYGREKSFNFEYSSPGGCGSHKQKNNFSALFTGT
jgi:hypothetical protein